MPFRSLALGILLAIAGSQATVITFSNDKASFLAASGATSATGPLTEMGYIGTNPVIGSVQLYNPHGIFESSAYSPPGAPVVDIATNDKEDLGITFLAGPVYSFGFELYEPIGVHTYGSPDGVQSTFHIVLSNGDSFDFEPTDNAWTFVGVASDSPFASVQITEIVGGIDDEFYGEIYTGGYVPVTGGTEAVPEPASMVLLGMGLLALVFFRKRAPRA